jgi:transporter family-2 protein
LGNTIYIAAAIAIGACLSLQPPINAAMARVLGSPLMAASISIAISLVSVLFIWLTWGKGAGDFAQVSALPWWVVIGGAIGVVFVVGSITVAPVLGIALFFACVVGGQLLDSTLADQFGAFGLDVKPVNTMKLLGLGLVLAGAALVESSNAGS